MAMTSIPDSEEISLAFSWIEKIGKQASAADSLTLRQLSNYTKTLRGLVQQCLTQTKRKASVKKGSAGLDPKKSQIEGDLAFKLGHSISALKTHVSSVEKGISISDSASVKQFEITIRRLNELGMFAEKMAAKAAHEVQLNVLLSFNQDANRK